MRKLLIIALVLGFATVASANTFKKFGQAGDDGIGTDADVFNISNQTHLQAVDRSHLTPIYVSPDGPDGSTTATTTSSTSSLEQGFDRVCGPLATEGQIGCDEASDCTGDGCDETNFFADKTTPLRSISAARLMFARNGCGQEIVFDDGDAFVNHAIGDNQSAFIDEGGFDDVSLTCVDTTNTEVGLYMRPLTEGERIYWNAAGQSDDGLTQTPATGGVTDPDPDYVLIAEAASTTTVLTDTSITMTVDFLIGLKLMVTDDSLGACALSDGDQRDITDNDANTITTDAFGAATDDCELTVMVDNASGNTPGDNAEHFDFTGVDDGMVIMENFDIFNCAETNCISNSSKPGVSVMLSGVTVDGELENGKTGPILHFNSPATSYFINTHVRNVTHSTPFNSSGPTVMIGSSFASAGVNDVQEVVIIGALGALLINTDIFMSHPGTGSTNKLALVIDGDNTDAGPAEHWLINTRIVNDTSNGTGIRNTTAAAVTSWKLRMFYSSISGVDTAFNLNPVATFKADWFMRSVMISSPGARIVAFQNGTGDVANMNFDHDNIVIDDINADDWDMETANIDTVTLARADIVANSPTALCCGATCAAGSGTNGVDTCFFGNESDLNGTAARGTAADSVRIGSCKSTVSECARASTYEVNETMPDRLCLPDMVTGEEICTWNLFTGSTAYAIGAQ